MDGMKKSTVVLRRCETYEKADVGAAVSDCIDALGGADALFPDKGARILIKPNLLTRAAPEKAVTTHPSVFGAVCRYLREAGCTELSYGDSPGTHFAGVKNTAEACGIAAEAEQCGVSLGDFEGGEETPFPDGITAKSFVITHAALSCDRIVNVCKLKTHMLERMTGAQKNLFGIVYGFNKGATHVKYPNSVEFARALADLNRFRPPVLHIMDAVVAMEGNGPSGGVPRDMGWILASTDPVALDTVACTLISLDPALVPTNEIGAEYGVGHTASEKIEVLLLDGAHRETLTLAEVAERYSVSDFDVYRGSQDKGEIKQLKPFRRFLDKRPVINAEKCVGCGVCVESCPQKPKAVAFPKGKKVPRYNYRLCIKCFCCQEMCPRHAISAQTPRLARLIDRNWKL